MDVSGIACNLSHLKYRQSRALPVCDVRHGKMRSGFIGHKWQDASQMHLGTMPLLCKFLVRKGRFVRTGQNRTSSSLLLSQVTIKSLALSPTPRSFSQHASSSTLSIITSMLRILLLSCHMLCVFHLDFVLNSATKPFRPSRLDTLLQTPVQANTVTFNTMQTVLDASGQWAMATLLLDLMGLSTVKPDPQSFNIATQLHSFQPL